MRTSFLVRRANLDDKKLERRVQKNHEISLKRPEERKYNFDFYKKRKTS